MQLVNVQKSRKSNFRLFRKLVSAARLTRWGPARREQAWAAWQTPLGEWPLGAAKGEARGHEPGGEGHNRRLVNGIPTGKPSCVDGSDRHMHP